MSYSAEYLLDFLRNIRIQQTPSTSDYETEFRSFKTEEATQLIQTIEKLIFYSDEHLRMLKRLQTSDIPSDVLASIDLQVHRLEEILNQQ